MSGLLILLRLVEQGVGIQATVFGRVNFDIAIALRELYSANPDALGEEPAAAVMHANAALFYRI